MGNSSITNAIVAIDAEIERLTAARVALMDLIDLPTVVGKRGPSKAAIESATRQLEAELNSPEFEEALNDVDELVTSEDRRTAANAKLDAIVKREKKNGKSGNSQRERILTMLGEGKSTGAIAAELGTHVSYVYTVRKSAQQKAPKRGARSNGKAKATATTEAPTKPSRPRNRNGRKAAAAK